MLLFPLVTPPLLDQEAPALAPQPDLNQRSAPLALDSNLIPVTPSKTGQQRREIIELSLSGPPNRRFKATSSSLQSFFASAAAAARSATVATMMAPTSTSWLTRESHCTAFEEPAELPPQSCDRVNLDPMLSLLPLPKTTAPEIHLSPACISNGDSADNGDDVEIKEAATQPARIESANETSSLRDDWASSSSVTADAIVAASARVPRNQMAPCSPSANAPRPLAHNLPINLFQNDFTKYQWETKSGAKVLWEDMNDACRAPTLEPQPGRGAPRRGRSEATRQVLKRP
jgi:hypothetical protein